MSVAIFLRYKDKDIKGDLDQKITKSFVKRLGTYVSQPDEDTGTEKMCLCIQKEHEVEKLEQSNKS